MKATERGMRAALTGSQAVRKLHGHLRAAKEAAVERTLPRVQPVGMAPHVDDVDAELDEAAQVRATQRPGQHMRMSEAADWSLQFPLRMAPLMDVLHAADAPHCLQHECSSSHGSGKAPTVPLAALGLACREKRPAGCGKTLRLVCCTGV